MSCCLNNDDQVFSHKFESSLILLIHQRRLSDVFSDVLSVNLIDFPITDFLARKVGLTHSLCTVKWSAITGSAMCTLETKLASSELVVISSRV